MNMLAPILLTEEQAAETLGVSLATLRRLRKSGALGYVRMTARMIRYRQEDLEAYRAWAVQEANPNPLPRALRPLDKLPLKPCVYFVRSGPHGPIKIGYARSLRPRLYALGTAHHDELILLATMAGGAVQERRLHEQFADLRMRGEWFKPAEDLLSFIEALQDWQ